MSATYTGAGMRLVVSYAVCGVVAVAAGRAGGALARGAGPRLQPLVRRPHARGAQAAHAGHTTAITVKSTHQADTGRLHFIGSFPKV